MDGQTKTHCLLFGENIIYGGQSTAYRMADAFPGFRAHRGIGVDPDHAFLWYFFSHTVDIGFPDAHRRMWLDPFLGA